MRQDPRSMDIIIDMLYYDIQSESIESNTMSVKIATCLQKMQNVSKKHKEKSLELMKYIISTSMEDFNVPDTVDQMTEMADKQLDAIMEHLPESKEEEVVLMEHLEESKEEVVPAIAPAARNKRKRSNKPPTMMLRNCRNNDRGVVKAKA